MSAQRVTLFFRQVSATAAVGWRFVQGVRDHLPEVFAATAR